MNMEQRKQLTLQRMKTALIQLLLVKDVNRITVQEIIANADVSRGTFYSYFNDIFDLMEAVENELLEQMGPCSYDPSDPVNDAFPDHFPTFACVRWFEYCAAHRDALLALLGPTGDPYFAYKLERQVRDNIDEHMFQGMEIPHPRDDRCLYHREASVQVFIGLMKYWLQQPEPISAVKIARIAQVDLRHHYEVTRS
ncbi:MAG: TetR/AcrR family transcriptional regulator [Oscillospiraceae bacterium]